GLTMEHRCYSGYGTWVLRTSARGARACSNTRRVNVRQSAMYVASSRIAPRHRRDRLPDLCSADLQVGTCRAKARRYAISSRRSLTKNRCDRVWVPSYAGGQEHAGFRRRQGGMSLISVDPITFQDL